MSLHVVLRSNSRFMVSGLLSKLLGLHVGPTGASGFLATLGVLLFAVLQRSLETTKENTHIVERA